MKIDGAVALITGGTGGIGRAAAVALLQRGAKVLLVDLDPKQGNAAESALKKTYGDDKVAFVACDVADKDSLEDSFSRAFTRFGRLDIVLNNAGVGELSGDRWTTVVDVNLTAVIRGTALALEAMERTKTAGVVVNTASMGGLAPMPFSPIYCGTKHGVIGYTRSVAQALHGMRSPIRANVICPSFTDTALVRDGMAVNSVFKAVVESLGPLIDPSLVATGIVQLIEDDTKNGAVMRVTGQNGIDYQQYGGMAKRSAAAAEKPGSKL